MATQEQQASRGDWWRRPVIFVPLTAAALALVALVVVVAPGLICPVTPAQRLDESDGGLETLTALVEQVSEPAERARLEAERVRLLDQRAQQVDARAQQASDLCVRRVTGLVPPLLTLAAAGVGAVIAWRQLQHNREQLQETLKAGQRERALNRSAQLAERFTRAVDQLGRAGAEHLDVRLGGIYALANRRSAGQPAMAGSLAGRCPPCERRQKGRPSSL